MYRYFFSGSRLNMIRKYKRKTQKVPYDDAKLQEALGEIRFGKSLRSVGKKYGINERTLRRHRDGKVKEVGKVKLGRHECLPKEFEKELSDHVREMNSRMFGLTAIDVRKLAYSVAEEHGIKHGFNQVYKMAGKDWLRGFMKRNNLSVRNPQPTSIARMVGFNRPKLNQFFEVYRKILSERNYSASNIYNMDETGITTVQKPGKVIAAKGTRNVSKATSAERGQLVTVVCAMNAVGSYVPPYFIFPRKVLRGSMLHGAPPGSTGDVSDSGWINETIFVKWLEHFVSHVRCTKESRCLIILDGHHSHKTLAAINFCRDNGIDLITLPPHCTHKMQPLDRSYFKPLKAAYNVSCDNWMINHPGNRMTIHDLACIFGPAYLKTAVAETAVNGFRASGLWPYNPEVFSDADFAASNLTEETEVIERPEDPMSLRDTLTNDENAASCSNVNPQISNLVNQEASKSAPSPAAYSMIIKKQSPVPKIAMKRKRTRITESSKLLTSTPEKCILQEEEKQKSPSLKVQLIKKTKTKSAKKLKFNGNSDEDETCIVCGELFSNSRSNEKWIKCGSCQGWSHELCTMGNALYVCHECAPE